MNVRGVPYKIPIEFRGLKGGRISWVGNRIQVPAVACEFVGAALTGQAQEMFISVGDEEGEWGLRKSFFPHEDHRCEGGEEDHRGFERMLCRRQVLGRAVTSSTVTHLVVRGGVGDQLPRRDAGQVQFFPVGAFPESGVGAAEAVAVAQGVSENVKGAVVLVISIVFAGDDGVEGMVDVVKPLRVEAVSTVLISTNDAWIVEVGLGDDDGAGFIRDPVDVLHDGVRGAVIIGMYGVEAQTIDVEFFEPLAHSIENVRADLI